ncbi:MAG: DUF4296 domain-containing protein [Sediminibacterium sp.]|nr:DUF4296 domain-containing protein [Sediminibacterium sp.]
MKRSISITKQSKVMFFTGLLMLLGCTGSPNGTEESKMVAVLADAMTMEAGHQIRYNFGLLPDSIWEKEYRFICNKHNIAYEDFVEDLGWYQAEPQEYSQLMEKVITRLQQADSRFATSSSTNNPKPNSMEARVRAMMDSAVEKGRDSVKGGIIILKTDKNRKR